MSRSRLQEPFMREIADCFVGTRNHILSRLEGAPPSEAAAIVEEALRGLYHGLFVTFDGGTALADEGLVRIVDEDGEHFDRFLHERCFDYWPASDSSA